MSVTTISNDGGNNKLTTALTYILGVVGIGLIVYFGGEFIKKVGGINKNAGLTVAPLNGQQEVFVNDASLGIAPMEATNIKPGPNKITLKSPGRQYDTTINFLANDSKYFHTVGIFRDLGTSDTFSSGQDFWFENDDSGALLRIISDPAGAVISIDDVEIGTTPFVSSSISEGGYDIKVAYDGYETQVPRVNVKNGYTLNVNVKLFPTPAPLKPKKVEGYNTLFNLSSPNAAVTADTLSWAKAVPYWVSTRGITTESTKPIKADAFDYLVDYKGNVFDKLGNPVTTKEDFANLKSAKKGGYLGRTIDGEGITQQASEAIALVGSGEVVVGGTKSAKINSTPTGWLRVRNIPGLNGSEIARVNVGDTYSILEQQTGWLKIKVSQTLEGWISSDYVTIF